MSEYASGVNNPERQEALPNMEVLDLIEAMSVEERIEHKRRYLSEISDREALCRMIDDVNEAEGADVSIIY